jgi:hypothetical protein
MMITCTCDQMVGVTRRSGGPPPLVDNREDDDALFADSESDDFEFQAAPVAVTVPVAVSVVSQSADNDDEGFEFHSASPALVMGSIPDAGITDNDAHQSAMVATAKSTGEDEMFGDFSSPTPVASVRDAVITTE